MKMFALATSLAATLLLTACNDDPATPDPQAGTPAPAQAATPADDAAETQAVYGDEAPVAIAPEPAADDHAHNADGSHPEGVAHGDDAHADDGHPHDADGGHPADAAADEAGHAHDDDADHTH